jgi:hypothetical protein
MTRFSIQQCSIGWCVNETSNDQNGDRIQLRKWYFKELKDAVDLIHKELQ